MDPDAKYLISIFKDVGKLSKSTHPGLNVDNDIDKLSKSTFKLNRFHNDDRGDNWQNYSYFCTVLKWIFEVDQRIQMLKKDLQNLFTQFYAKACQECKESDVMEKRVQRIWYLIRHLTSILWYFRGTYVDVENFKKHP